MVTEKNATAEGELYEQPYYVSSIERRLITTKEKKQLFKAQHPHHRFRLEELDIAHSIHVFNQFEEEGYLEFFPYHSRLVDLASDTLHVQGRPKGQRLQ